MILDFGVVSGVGKHRFFQSSFFFVSLSPPRPRPTPTLALLLPHRAARTLRMLSTRAAAAAAASADENTAPAPKKQHTMEAAVPPLRVKKLVPHARLPVRGSAGAAGYDLAR